MDIVYNSNSTMSKASENIRNFLITAHIDHGKSTLADRMLEITGTIEKRSMKPQFLDQLELERERGITIKMAPVRMVYRTRSFGPEAGFGLEDSRIVNKPNSRLQITKLASGPTDHILNLIDTPGHSDFAYEVSRALAAVEGAVLLVDATQGIQAQTLANFENARKNKLTIIGAVNKIDVATPEQIENSISELAELLTCGEEEILKVSGKTGDGVPELLAAIIERIPPPKSTSNIEPQTSDISRSLVFDSLYDEHKGVIAFIRVFNGEFKIDEDIYLIATDVSAKAKEIGTFSPKLKPTGILHEGEIGYIATGIKDPDKLKIGDTLLSGISHLTSNLQQFLLPGYKEPKPVVFVSFYPEESDDYDELKKALGKLHLTDSALVFDADFSEVLGRGFKGGFLGRLHFEITAERLAREFKINTVHSFPSVAYRVRRKARPGEKDFDWELITNPKDFPDDYADVEEPMTSVEILTPTKYLGNVLSLKQLFRFSKINTKNIGDRILITANLPLSDLIHDLDDKLKSVSEGFASLSYELSGYEQGDVAKLEVLVTEQVIPGLTRILPKKDIDRQARSTVEKLKELLPRQSYSQALQAASSGRIIARETIPAMQKLLGSFGKTGGDRTRKMKLWKKQQRGKKRLKERAETSQIKIPASVFKELLKK